MEYKNFFTEEEWEKEWEAILAKYGDSLYSIGKWLAHENRYDLIMDSAEPDYGNIVLEYEKELFSLYPERCLKVWEKEADSIAEWASNRSDYRNLTRKLHSLASHPGGEHLGKELATKYRALYPRRTAMFDEFQKAHL